MADIAKNEFVDFLRATALNQISDKHVLAEVAKTNPFHDICEKAVDKISDKSILEDIAKNCSNEYVALYAAKKINDKSLIDEINKKIDDNIKEEKAEKDNWTFDTPQEYEYKLRYFASNGMLNEATELYKEAIKHYPEKEMEYTLILGLSAKK